MSPHTLLCLGILRGVGTREGPPTPGLHKFPKHGRQLIPGKRCRLKATCSNNPEVQTPRAHNECGSSSSWQSHPWEESSLLRGPPGPRPAHKECFSKPPPPPPSEDVTGHLSGSVTGKVRACLFSVAIWTIDGTHGTPKIIEKSLDILPSTVQCVRGLRLFWHFEQKFAMPKPCGSSSFGGTLAQKCSKFGRQFREIEIQQLERLSRDTSLLF